VEVEVTAAIVPVSFEIADRVKEDAAKAVLQFLHPLTGGAAGRGWAFGRRPHLSDLYAVLEKVAGVDYVYSLSIESPSLDKLPADRLDRFLIYSGPPKISIISPSKGV
jgi:hypothetical protein